MGRINKVISKKNSIKVFGGWVLEESIKSDINLDANGLAWKFVNALSFLNK